MKERSWKICREFRPFSPSWSLLMRPLPQEHVVLGKRFALPALTASAGWTARTLFLLGSAAVSGLLIGACVPGLSMGLAVERIHALFLPGFLLSLGLGLALGVGQTVCCRGRQAPNAAAGVGFNIGGSTLGTVNAGQIAGMEK